MQRLRNSLLGYIKIFMILAPTLEKCCFQLSKVVELTSFPSSFTLTLPHCQRSFDYEAATGTKQV